MRLVLFHAHFVTVTYKSECAWRTLEHALDLNTVEWGGWG